MSRVRLRWMRGRLGIGTEGVLERRHSLRSLPRRTCCQALLPGGEDWRSAKRGTGSEPSPYGRSNLMLWLLALVLLILAVAGGIAISKFLFLVLVLVVVFALLAG